MPAHWSDQYDSAEITKVVRRLAAENLSARQIADRIGLNVTKNMVASFAHNARPKITFNSARAIKRKSAIDALKRAADHAAIVVTAPRPKFVILEELFEPVHQLKLRPGDRRCRMPLWPDRMGSSERTPTSELMYCGQQTAEGSSWCPACRNKVYEAAPAPVRRGEGRKHDDSGRRMGWEYGT